MAPGWWWGRHGPRAYNSGHQSVSGHEDRSQGPQECRGGRACPHWGSHTWRASWRRWHLSRGMEGNRILGRGPRVEGHCSTRNIMSEGTKVFMFKVFGMLQSCVPAPPLSPLSGGYLCPPRLCLPSASWPCPVAVSNPFYSLDLRLRDLPASLTFPLDVQWKEATASHP